MAEWLRRLTRNQIPSGSVGSNPTDCEKQFFCLQVNHIPYIFVNDTLEGSTVQVYINTHSNS